MGGRPNLSLTCPGGQISLLLDPDVVILSFEVGPVGRRLAAALQDCSRRFVVVVICSNVWSSYWSDCNGVRHGS